MTFGFSRIVAHSDLKPLIHNVDTFPYAAVWSVICCHKILPQAEVGILSKGDAMDGAYRAQKLPIFLLFHRASTHDTTGLTSASLVFGRELRLPCHLLFGAPPTVDHAETLVDHLHVIHNYARQHLKLAGDRMKTRYDRLANCAGYHEGDKVWFYRPTRTKMKSLQSSCEGPYKWCDIQDAAES
jgi:hypothetical protein